MQVTMIGLDIAKQVFQVCGVDESGAEVLRRRLRRGSVLKFFAALSPTVIGMEACSTAHYWARQLGGLGHQVRLVPPRYVKSYVWRNKTDAADAAAICAALRDPRIHPVPVKSEAQQAVLALHRSRELLVRQRTTVGNALRAHLAEFGEIAPQGHAGLAQLRAIARDPASAGLPPVLEPALAALAALWVALDRQAKDLEREIVRLHRQDEVAKRLATIPGVGPITASALSASIGDPRLFRTGRHLSAWLGLTPRESSSALKRRQGGITRWGNTYLRRLMVLGAHSILRRQGTEAANPWLAGIKARRPTAVAAVAQANKTARIVWAVLNRETVYQPRSCTA